MHKLVALAVLPVIAALGFQATPAQAAEVTLPSTYHCAKTVLTSTSTVEMCSLTATLTGPMAEYQLDISGHYGEQATFYQQTPQVWFKGVLQPQGMGAGHSAIEVPYWYSAGGPAKHYKARYTWSVAVPLHAPKPSMKVVNLNG